MKRLLSSAAVLALAWGLALPAQAKTAKAAEKMATKEDMKEQASSLAGTPGAVLRQVKLAEERLIALANAIPDEKYTWRPGQGVRSTEEVFNHVTAANYYVPTFWGAQVPADIKPQDLEKMHGDKAKTIAALKKSFEHAKATLQGVSEADLDRKIKLFGQDATMRDAMLALATHDHEHLGQMIAYARSNGVVPPWSQ